MNSREIRTFQKQFIAQCLESSQTLDEIMDDLNLPSQTLAGWLTQKDFRVRLHGLRRHLRRTRELQVEIGAMRAAAALTRASSGTDENLKPVVRAACVDLIRLSRDSRARSRAVDPSADDLTKRRALYHPNVPADEAQSLMDELARREEVACA